MTFQIPGKAIVAAIAFSISSLGAAALTPESYYQQKKRMQEGGVSAEVSLQLWRSYLGGLREAFGAMYLLNDSSIPVMGFKAVCAPDVTVFTAEMMEAAIQLQLGTYKQPRNLTKEETARLVGMHALVGLAKMFPCNGGSGRPTDAGAEQPK